MTGVVRWLHDRTRVQGCINDRTCALVTDRTRVQVYITGLCAGSMTGLVCRCT
jgi:hypothetical protein